MSKVIQYIKLVLHRGLERKTKDPFIKTINLPVPRCSGTLSKASGRHYISKQKLARITGLISSFVFISLLFLSIFPIVSHQETVIATPGDDPNALTHLTITTAEQTASVDLVPVSSNGTFATSDDTTIASNNTIDFSVDTTNYTGYNLNLKARADDTTPNLLTNMSAPAPNNTLSSITTATSEADFSANTSTAATNYNGKWGFKPNKLNGIANSNYLPAPTTSGILLDTTTGANTTANNYTIAVGARADYTKPSGTYTNTYELIATANPVAYAILYYDLSGIGTATSQKNDAGLTWNTVSGSTAKEATYTEVSRQTSTTNTATTITLTPPTSMARDTYTFAGWCRNSTDHTKVGVNKTVTAIQNSSNKVTAYNNPSTMCNGVVPNYNTSTDYFIKAGDTTFKLDPTKDNNTPDGAIILTAVWKPTTFATAFTAAGLSATPNMQSVTKANVCNSVTPNQFTTMIDNRPNAKASNTTTSTSTTSYNIIKLMDGNCWMADNLDLNLNNPTVRNNLTYSNTNVPSNTTGTNILNALRIGGGTASNGYAQAAWANVSGGTATVEWDGVHNPYNYGLASRNGKCDPDANSTFQCLSPYQNTTYTYDKVIDKYGFPASDSSGTATTTYNFGIGNYKIGAYYNYCAA